MDVLGDFEDKVSENAKENTQGGVGLFSILLDYLYHHRFVQVQELGNKLVF